MNSNIYVKNTGMTSETVFLNNNKISKHDVGWDAGYDGNEANISVDVQENGARKHFDVNLTNDDLANILNIQSIKQPIHQRLKHDFKKKNPILYNIHLDDDIHSQNYMGDENDKNTLLETIQQPAHISSPLSNEEFIVPVTIGNETSHNYTFTPRRRHKKIKTHKTHKIYKKRKTNTSKHISRKNKRSSRKLQTI